MTLRVCNVVGCGTLVARNARSGRCPLHQAEQRRTRDDHGYGWKHRQRRAHLLRSLNPGTPCPMCGLPMLAGQQLQLDHAIPLALDSESQGNRLVHANCNAAAGGRLGHALRN